MTARKHGARRHRQLPPLPCFVLLSFTQVGRRLGCSVATVRVLVGRGQIRRHVRSPPLIHRRDVERFRRRLRAVEEV